MIDLDHLIDKKPEEKIIFQMRSHWILFLGELVLLWVLAALPIGLYVVFSGVWPSILIGTLSKPILVLMTSAYYLMLWTFFITKFIDYYLDVYLVTTDRVLDVSQQGMFARTVSELDLARVQDVTSEVKGILRSLMNFGNVYIETAGAKERFIFEDVKHPDLIRKRLLELVEDDRKRQGEVIAELGRPV
ncbi:MAG TPA: PH domain-containing protein [Candidatus Binatia bacterium]|jgi:membrane protein YdbS with pleckstrin-like domain|nr:PH domain-containing protein [Candidatus Binatia bacterium]